MKRLNRLSHFYIKGGNIILKLYSNSKILKLKYSQNIYDFFVFLLENQRYSESDLRDFGISSELEQLLIVFRIILVGNSGTEIYEFDTLTFNPSFCVEAIDFNTLEKNADKLERGLTFLNIDNLNKENLNDDNIEFNFSSKDFCNLKSIRHGKNYVGTNIDITKILKFVFEKNYTRNNRSFFKYGSGGALNPIFPCVINKTDEIIIYDKYQNKLYRKKSKGIFKYFSENCLVPCSTSFEKYDSFILLFADTRNVYGKYVNRALRLFLLESGQISFLLRMFCGKNKIPYLELQGYFDKAVYELIKKENIFLLEGEELYLNHIIAIG